MNFTNSPFERMMKQKPYVPHNYRYPGKQDAAKCPNGDKSTRGTSGQLDPKSLLKGGTIWNTEN